MIDGDRGGIVQHCERSNAVARISGRAGSGQCGERSIRSHLVDTMGSEVRNVNDARAVDRDVAGRDESERSRHAALVFTAGGQSAAAGDGRDDSGRRNPADAGVAQVGDVEISGEIEGQAVGRIELRRRGGSIIARESGDAVAGDGPDVSVARDAADAVIIGVRYIYVADVISDNSLGLKEDSGGSGNVLANPVADGDR